ncbi:MAG: spermine synthase [Balneolaceae bacterium]|nr:MAG: spermine synthase [Balneolaceae bacterium]
MFRRIRIAVIVMGFSGLVAEIFLLRELLIVFSGNELSIGIILANWLLLEALGCFWPGRMIDRTKNKLAAFALVTVLFSVALIAAVFAIRILKVMLGVSIGEHVGLLPMFYSSFLVLLPVSVLHGALFTFSCRIYARYHETDDAVAGRVYVDETIGTMAGGVLCTFLLIPLLNTFEVVVGVAFVNMLVCLWMIWPADRNVALPALLGILALVSGTALLTGQADRIHQSAIRMQWMDHNVVHYQNSPYSNITVLENQGQYLFFLDGIPEIITPVPDMVFVEEFVHLPMLAHPDPQDILVLRGGAGGMIDEVLKHPSVQNVTYAEHDPAFLEVIRKFPTPMTESELNDPRVRIRYRDGRLLLATAPQTYDIVFIGVMEPSNLQSNRFFTREFFALAEDRLNEGGILVLTVPGSLTFLSDELKNLNSTIFNSLVDVFPHIRAIPGEHRNLYLASGSPEVAELDLDRIVRRLEERQIRAEGVVPWHIEKKLHEGWQQWFRDYIAGASQNVNRDFNPVGLYYHITHWNSLYAPAFGSIYNRLEDIGPATVLPALLLFTMLVLLIRFRRPKTAGFGVPFAIITTGFAGMIFSLVVIFMFQVTYGNVFSWIGLLVAFFMAGAAIGAMMITRILPRLREDKRSFLTTEMVIICFTLLLPLVFQAIHPLLDSDIAFTLFRILFLVLSLIAGMLVGIQYPLANRLQLQAYRRNVQLNKPYRQSTGLQPDNGNAISRAGGMLYASDLIGGWLGGIAGGVVLLPVMGVTGTCITVALLKFTSFLITAAEPSGRYNEVLP